MISHSNPEGLSVPIPFMDFNGHGEKILFLHANGYPPACYRPLLEALTTRYHPVAMLMRPLWPGAVPEGVSSWVVFSEDVLKFIAEQDLSPAMVVGHSFGAIAALRAALEMPGRFAALVLIDPVLYPRPVILSWWLLRALGIAERIHPMIQGALKRRTTFRSRDEAFQRYRRHRIFRYLSDEHLRVCIEGLILPQSSGGFRLAYPPAWEARVYYTAIWSDWDLWRNISSLKIPVLIVRGEASDTFWKSTADAAVSRNPRLRVISVQRASHLVALEHPDEVSRLTIDFLQRSKLAQVAEHAG